VLLIGSQMAGSFFITPARCHHQGDYPGKVYDRDPVDPNRRKSTPKLR
jgi:hypothetical protein